MSTLARTFTFAAIVLSCASPHLPGQQPPPARGSRSAPPALSTREFAGVMENNGALLGTARSYRATFEAAGVEYLPALGKLAPRAEPFRVRFASLRRGDGTPLVTAGVTPARTHDRRTVAYQWPWLVERYEARAGGLEQSFVFATPPAGRGDLIVRLDVETALPACHDGRIAWLSPSGGVTFGDVAGIDANGTRCAGRARHVDGGVELSLPGWFVDGAAYPLTLDPLIGTAVEALSGADCDFPDVAYDGYSNTYCVVWTQFFGGGSTGAVGSVFLADTLGFGYAFAINQPGDEDSVRVCDIGGTGVFVMMWVNYGSGGSSISGLAFEPVQAQATNVFTLYGPANVASPVLSSEATVYDDDCLVAFLDDTYGLIGCTVAVDQNLQPSATQLVQIAAGFVTEPAISKQGGNPGVHLITWIDRPPGLPGWVRAQVVDHDMNLIGPGFWVQNTPQNCGYPAVDGDGFKFLVAWEEQELANPSASDIHGRLLTIGPSGGISSQGPTIALVAYPNDADFAVDVALLGDKFGITYMGEAPGAAYWDDVYFKALAANGTPIGDEMRCDLTPGNNYRYEHTPRLIGRRDGNPNTSADDGLLAFADQSVTTYDSDVGLQLVEAMGPGGAIADLGGGCGPGGLAVAPGPFALGNTAFSFELYGAQSLAIPFLLLGVPAPLLTCGVCSVIQPVTFTFVANTAGTSQSPFVVPGDGSLVGFQLDFQFLSFNVNYVGCPLLPGVAASNIVRATLGY
ncbi:MAG TPA: hypothetical protein VFZ65_16485 [Planctomycetota bacterium]|nr:hypothetical protein [Planctomycetota bacterium]